MNTSFPKTLIGFYARRAAPRFVGIIFIWAILALVAGSFNGIMWPWFQRWLVAMFETPPPIGTSLISQAMPLVLLIMFSGFFVNTARIFRDLLLSRWRAKMRRSTTIILNRYVHSQSMSFWTGRMPGKINSQINYITEGFFVLISLVGLAAALLLIFVNIGLVMELRWQFAAIMAAAMAVRLVWSLMLMRRMTKSAEASSEAQSALSGKIMDSLSSYFIVKLFAASKREEKYLDAPHDDAVRASINARFWQRMFYAMPTYLWDVAFASVIIACASSYSSGGMKVSEVVFTFSVYFNIMAAMGGIVDQIPDVADAAASASQAYRELIKPVEVVDAPGAPDLAVSRGAVEIKDISFKYKKKMVLDKFSLNILPGEKVGIVGSSGAGKTTLVNLLMRLYDPTKGAVFIDGQNIKDAAQDSVRRNIAFIPQEPSMFNRTLRDNIGYGRPDATMAQIRAAAKHAQVDDFIMATEKKYESFVGDRGIKLSGGQKQRVAIARAFLKDAPILILDEATSALDSETERAIQKSFDDLSRGRTTIAIAHRLSTLRHMDRIVVVENGRIAEQGSHAALLKKKGIYARLWKMQSGGFI